MFQSYSILILVGLTAVLGENFPVFVRLQDVTAASMKTIFFLGCCAAELFRRFRGAYFLHNQGDKKAAGVKLF